MSYPAGTFLDAQNIFETDASLKLNCLQGATGVLEGSTAIEKMCRPGRLYPNEFTKTFKKTADEGENK